jgi:hypothetical protein
MELGPKRKFPPLVLASSIEPKEINWLWYPYIPAGSASMLFGPGGTGKSHIAVDIAARLSRGEALPESKPLPAQNVLIMSAEDEFDRVLVPRLVKAGADLNRVAFPKLPFTLDKEGIGQVEEYLTSFVAGIVFIDPVVAYIGRKVDINKANETREFTGELHQMAMRTGASIVVVHHSRKGNEGADYERAMGSADFNNAVRSVLYTVKAPNGDRVLRHVKANYAPLGPSLGYDFGEAGFQWTGIYEEDHELKVEGAKQSAGGWLRERLAKGPVASSKIEAEAAEKGLNMRTLNRAKNGIAESFLVTEAGTRKWYWRLKNGEEQADVPVMGDQWGAEKPDRVQREIRAREDERARDNGPKVGQAGPVHGRKPGLGNPDDVLEQWAKDNL